MHNNCRDNYYSNSWDISNTIQSKLHNIVFNYEQISTCTSDMAVLPADFTSSTDEVVSECIPHRGC